MKGETPGVTVSFISIPTFCAHVFFMKCTCLVSLFACFNTLIIGLKTLPSFFLHPPPHLMSSSILCKQKDFCILCTYSNYWGFPQQFSIYSILKNVVKKHPSFECKKQLLREMRKASLNNKRKEILNLKSERLSDAQLTTSHFLHFLAFVQHNPCCICSGFKKIF